MANFPIAVGHPDHKLSGYIPDLYSKTMLKEFYKSTVFGEIANTDYEGEVSKLGDKVKIRVLPDIDITDYVKGEDLNYQTPVGSTVELLIDKAKKFAYALNAVDTKQIDLDYIQKWAEHAAMRMKIAIDSSVLQAIYADATLAGATAGVNSNLDFGASGAAESITSANIIEYITRMAQGLDEYNVPEDHRFIVAPPWFIQKLKISDLKDASITGDGKSVLRNGKVGMVDRFHIYSSNSLLYTSADSGCHNILFGEKCATTFASQMVVTEQLKNPNDFGDLVRGLQVYGFEVIKPEALGNLYATPGAES